MSKGKRRLYGQAPIDSLYSPDFTITSLVFLTHTLSHLTPWGEWIILQLVRRTIYWASPGTHHCWVARGISEWEMFAQFFFYANEHRWIRSCYPVTAWSQVSRSNHCAIRTSICSIWNWKPWCSNAKTLRNTDVPLQMPFIYLTVLIT